nr:hypothetical protein P5658_09110 [Bacillus subtilis]
MAQPIGNMVVKVGLDDTGFNRGIEGLKRQMRLANSEMKAVPAVFIKIPVTKRNSFSRKWKG